MTNQGGGLVTDHRGRRKMVKGSLLSALKKARHHLSYNKPWDLLLGACLRGMNPEIVITYRNRIVREELSEVIPRLERIKALADERGDDEMIRILGEKGGIVSILEKTMPYLFCNSPWDQMRGTCLKGRDPQTTLRKRNRAVCKGISEAISRAERLKRLADERGDDQVLCILEERFEIGHDTCDPIPEEYLSVPDLLSQSPEKELARVGARR